MPTPHKLLRNSILHKKQIADTIASGTLTQCTGIKGQTQVAALTSKGVGAEYIELNKDPSAPVIARPEVPIAGFTWAECSYLCRSAFQ